MSKSNQSSRKRKKVNPSSSTSEHDWPSLRASMRALAAKLTAEQSEQLPTNLARIAAFCRVERIEFRPLLVNGGLSVLPEGFHIFVNCPEGAGMRYTELFEADGTGRLLPAIYAERARYTIAHELAHTFLFDTSTKPPTDKIRASSKATINELEKACNATAGALLLPRRALLKRLNDAEVINPNVLSSLAKSALVSRPALVFRLADLKGFFFPIGAIACVSYEGGQWLIKAFACNNALKPLFHPVILNAPVESLTREITPSLFSASTVPRIVTRTSWKFECLLERDSQGRPKRSTILTMIRC